MTRRVVSLLAAHLVASATLMALLAAVDGRAGLGVGSLAAVVGFTAAFALVGLLPMHVEFRRSACTITLVEAVLVVALLFMPLGGVAVAFVVGEALACVLHRQSGLKLTYNTAATASSVLLGACVAGAAARAVGDASMPGFAAVAAVFCYGIASHTATSAVLRLVEERPFAAVFRDSAAMVGVATAVSTSIGLAGAGLVKVNPFAPLLLAPLVATVALETRRVAAHRAEHLRFERLYAASARTAGLQGFDAALAVSAGEARSLVTGSVAVCCAPDRTGLWRGVLVDDNGERPAGDALVAAVVELVTASGMTELPTGAIPAEVRSLLPSAGSVVLAGRVDDDAEARVALAVFREIRGDDQGEARSEVLGAFVGHAALTTTNARLYEEVEEALRHQVDLNRQKDDFLAAVSHELRTPLAAVLGSVATLRRLNERLPEDTKERFYDMAARQGKRLQRLIEELLMIAAVDQQEEGCYNVPVELTPMLTELADELSDLAEDRIVVAVAPGAETVHSDEVKLRQVLVNLVENAAKYAPEGRIKVLAWPANDGDGVAITVVDHGPGIPPEDRQRVFERFVQLDQSSTRQHGGTGLGLYLCKRLTEVIGADLQLTETPGGGCTFTVRLDAPIPTGTGTTAVDMDDRVPSGSHV